MVSGKSLSLGGDFQKQIQFSKFEVGESSKAVDLNCNATIHPRAGQSKRWVWRSKLKELDNRSMDANVANGPGPDKTKTKTSLIQSEPE